VWCREAEAGVRFIGPGGSGEEGSRPVAVEFYSSSVSKELNWEEETGRRFGSSTRTRRRAADSSRSRRWETMPWWAVPGRKAKRSGPVLVGMKERRKWGKRRNGLKAKEAAAKTLSFF
jgi:hypothetical protein